MQSSLKLVRRISWSIVAVLALHTSLASAVMIGPEAAMPSNAPSQAEVDRAKVDQFLDRASVKERLQAMGVGALNARDRVGALSQEEVHALAQRIDSMPAGGSLSEMDMILILLVALVVLVAL